MRTLTTGAATSTEHPGVEQLSWFTRLEQPIFPWRKIFVDFISRFDKQDPDKFRLRRWYAGIDWRLTRDWWFMGSLSEDIKGKNFGYSSQLIFNPDDYFTLLALYNSYSLNVPLRARVFGIKAAETNFTLRYRQSDYLDMSDNNRSYSFTLRMDKAITTGPYWRTRVALEGNSTSTTKSDVAYFNPRKLYSLEATPMIEHVWFRRYERALVDRFYIGGGAQWQQHFSPQAIGHARYEQDWKLSDTFSVLMGIQYNRRNYDGDESAVWTYDILSRFNF
jgi:hypothetical protein